MPAAEVSFLKAPPRVADAWASILGDDPDTDVSAHSGIPSRYRQFP
jgi:hypothetical protein